MVHNCRCYRSLSVLLKKKAPGREPNLTHGPLARAVQAAAPFRDDALGTDLSQHGFEELPAIAADHPHARHARADIFFGIPAGPGRYFFKTRRYSASGSTH